MPLESSRPASCPACGSPDAAPDGRTSTVLRIEKMDCPTEERLIREKLQGVPGIGALEFNLLKRTLAVTHEPDALPRALSALADLAMPAIVQEAGAEKTVPHEPSKFAWAGLAFAGVAAVAAEVAEWNGAPSWLTIGFALAAILTGGIETYKKGWIALRHANLNINALMSIAVTGAMLIGYWPEAAMVMFLFALAEVIEAKSLDRARGAIRDLMALSPDTATARQADGSWKQVRAEEVAAGTVVRVRPGERLALDGSVVSGRSTVDQAPITGESLPVEKSEGDAVYAGTVNQAGSFEYRTTAPATESTLARIIHVVERAQASKAPTQRFVDRFSRVYTPAVFAAAIAFAVAPPLFFGGDWMQWIYRGLVLLVIACPCALVISTPVTIVSALASAARRGILVKGGAYLEVARHVRVIAIDKTGTLTSGRPRQTDFAATSGEDAAQMRRMAASLAARSDHPVSLAIAHAAQGERIALQDVEDFEALPGRGVRGRIGGRLHYLGNRRLMEELRIASGEMSALGDRHEADGKTLVYLATADGILGLFAVADTVRDTSREAVRQMRELGVRTVLLTGDNARTAASVAAQVGVDEARGGLLPEDKLRIVEQLGETFGKVGMVGDGINDAPALARADVGIAMGAAGTGTAIETADVALMDDDLRKVPALLRLSRRTAGILKQNIAIALGIKAIFIAMTIAGTATMWMAVFADMGASLIVVFNGLRLLRR